MRTFLSFWYFQPVYRIPILSRSVNGQTILLGLPLFDYSLFFRTIILLLSVPIYLLKVYHKLLFLTISLNNTAHREVASW